MRRFIGVAIGLAALAASGCEEERSDDTAQVTAPAPVAPVEVTPGQDEELTRLRARVTELEQQLATCQTSGTQTAVVPEGVEPPSDGTRTASAAQADAGVRDAGRRARRDRDPSIIDTILGTDGQRRRRRDDEPLDLPNPARVLLGN